MRAILFAFAVLALTLVRAGSAQSLELIRLGTGPDEATAPLVYAVQAGLYKKYGLDVQVMAINGGGAAVAAAVAGGSLEIGKNSSFGFVTSVAKGLPFTAIGAGSYYNYDDPDTVLVVSSNSNVKTAKDLVGQTLATVALGDQNAMGLFAWLEQQGVNPSTVKYIEIPASATLAAMEAGRVVGSTLYEPFFSQAVASGKAHVLGYPYHAFGRHFAQAVLFANTRWVSEHQDTVTKFLRATQESAQYVSAHESEVALLVMKFTGAAAPSVRHPGRGVGLSPGDIQPLIDVAAKYQIIPKVFPAQSVICTCAFKH